MPERVRFERVLGWSLAASIVVHLLLLLLSPLFIQTDRPPGGAAPVAVDAPQSVGMEMIVAIPSADAPEIPPSAEVVQPTEQPVVQPPVAPITAPGVAPPAPSAPAANNPPGDNTAGDDPLRSGYRDPRLYVRSNPYTFDPRSDQERYEERFQARIDAINDSLGVAAARNRTTSDWTTTDADGNRWGLSPDGLHLGPITIPSALLPKPAPTGDNATREAAAERERQRQEIRRQEEERERRATQQERIDATREEQSGRRETSGGR